ncbi:hypothetical protein [Micromonospora sp. S-DT3-3-22]|uniref:hypothetical protein n=1 Tax=Micromonospora sp. S-DT3-3-22 TaxID=2755359 RepID=UPI00189066E6|nr:hypothetical protein [Micromonospora sp. S-DT3-3-22]
MKAAIWLHMRMDAEMASSGSNRKGSELETPVDDAARVVDGPSVVGVVASRRGVIVRPVTVVFPAAAAIGLTGVIATGTDVALAVASAAFAVASTVIAGADVRRNVRLLPGAGGAVLLRGAAGLLPGWAACRYREEWAGELYDLRAEGASWWRRAGYILGILLCGVPKLAVGLRLGGERSRA